MSTGSRRRTPDRFRLPIDVLEAAEAEAAASGRMLDDVIADALAEQLPDMIAEALRVVLPASVRRARPVEAEVVGPSQPSEPSEHPEHSEPSP